ncbi:hypothetical protein ACEWY4_020623 [Coilia grayii]|uniref:Large ribosomal subunit protein uL2m n=1 Tax=Coilia grayii TaxID=363190 RepID=A0ABD1J6M4_9TELE
MQSCQDLNTVACSFRNERWGGGVGCRRQPVMERLFPKGGAGLFFGEKVEEGGGSGGRLCKKAGPRQICSPLLPRGVHRPSNQPNASERLAPDPTPPSDSHPTQNHQVTLTRPNATERLAPNPTPPSDSHPTQRHRATRTRPNATERLAPDPKPPSNSLHQHRVLGKAEHANKPRRRRHYVSVVRRAVLLKDTSIDILYICIGCLWTRECEVTSRYDFKRPESTAVRNQRRYLEGVMAVSALSRGLRVLSLSGGTCKQVLSQVPRYGEGLPEISRMSSVNNAVCQWRGFLTSPHLEQNRTLWKQREKYTIRPVGMKKTGGRDWTGKIRTHGIGGGHKQRHRIIDFQRLRYELGKEEKPFEERVLEVRYDPCRSADIALVAGGNRKRWIIATENMEIGDVVKSSGVIGRMAVAAKEGDAHPLGALPVGTLINNLELYPGKGAQVIRAAGTSGVLLRKVSGTAIVQLPSKHQIQVSETCVATVGRVSNIDHNKRIIGKAGRNRWLGIRPSSGLWQRKGGWAGRKIKPLPPMKSYVNMPSVTART